MLVRIQLFRMPGDERKFNRRRMVARIPTCKRARENAAQTSVSDGISIIGVGNVSTTGGKVGEGVAMSDGGDGVGDDAGVAGVLFDEDAVGDSVGGGGVDEAGVLFGDAAVGDSVGGGGVDVAVTITGWERGEASITG